MPALQLLRNSPAGLWGPLGFHCQGNKFEKHATLKEGRLSEKRNTFAHYNFSLSTSTCFADHEKRIQTLMGH